MVPDIGAEISTPDTDAAAGAGASAALGAAAGGAVRGGGGAAAAAIGGGAAATAQTTCVTIMQSVQHKACMSCSTRKHYHGLTRYQLPASKLASAQPLYGRTATPSRVRVDYSQSRLGYAVHRCLRCCPTLTLDGHAHLPNSLRAPICDQQ